jgi:hypothetical protein
VLGNDLLEILAGVQTKTYHSQLAANFPTEVACGARRRKPNNLLALLSGGLGNSSDSSRRLWSGFEYDDYKICAIVVSSFPTNPSEVPAHPTHQTPTETPYTIQLDTQHAPH